MACTDSCHRPVGRQAHCSQCHRTFSGVTWFDRHQIGGGCHEVKDLIEKDGLWATAERHANNVVLAQQLARIRNKVINDEMH